MLAVKRALDGMRAWRDPQGYFALRALGDYERVMRMPLLALSRESKWDKGIEARGYGSLVIWDLH